MADVIFWVLFFIVIGGLSIPMFRFLDKNLYDGAMKQRSRLQKLKPVFTYISGPFLCSCIYTISSSNSFASFIAFWGLGFFISSFVFWATAKKTHRKYSVSLSESPRKIETFCLLLSLAIPNIQLFFVFSLILAGFHIPWK